MTNEEIKQEDKLLCALSYPIGIIALILILLEDKKKIRFVRYHGFQALFFNLAFVAFWILISILTQLPGIGLIIGIIVFFLGGLVSLLWLVLAIMYAIKAYNGAFFTIPFITDFSKKYVEE